MFLILVVPVLVAIVVAERVLVFRQQRVNDCGWMSERWIAEYRAAHV
jgi:hypothetical protein